MAFLDGTANAVTWENTMMYFPENLDRRNGEKRVDIALPLIFTHFNSNRLYSEHPGVFHNQGHRGGCFTAMEIFPIGTILFIRWDIHQADIAANGNELMENQLRIATLAEVRWCMPVKNENSKAEYKVGVHYL